MIYQDIPKFGIPVGRETFSEKLWYYYSTPKKSCTLQVEFSWIHVEGNQYNYSRMLDLWYSLNIQLMLAESILITTYLPLGTIIFPTLDIHGHCGSNMLLRLCPQKIRLLLMIILLLASLITVTIEVSNNHI